MGQHQPALQELGRWEPRPQHKTMLSVSSMARDKGTTNDYQRKREGEREGREKWDPGSQEWEELKATPHKVVSMDGFNHILLARGVKLGEPWRALA